MEIHDLTSFDRRVECFGLLSDGCIASLDRRLGGLVRIGHLFVRQLIDENVVLIVDVVFIGLRRLRQRRFVLRICTRFGSILVTHHGQMPRARGRSNVQRRIRFGLNDLDQAFLHELENGAEGDRHTHAAFFDAEHLRELDEGGAAQRAQDVGHALANGQFVLVHLVMREHLGALHHILQGQQHFLQRDLRKDSHDLALHELDRSRQVIAFHARQQIDVLGCLLEAFVFLQPAYQLGARVFFFATFRRTRPRQQHARFDLGEHRRHEQIFARQLELQLRHDLDVLHVLPRDLGDRNVENVEILAADQIQQQIERAFECFEEDLQRIRRNIEIAR